jgi:hypothetical protein
MSKPRKLSGVHGVSPEMRAKVNRLIELEEAHHQAIREGGDQPFYSDGRHQELVDLLPEVHRAFGLKLWEDTHTQLLAIRDGFDEA